MKAINQDTLNHIWDYALVINSSFSLPQQQNLSDSPARKEYMLLQWLVIIVRLSHSYLDGVSNEHSVPSCKPQNPRITEGWGWKGTPRVIKFNLPDQAASPRNIAQDCVQMSLECLKEGIYYMDFINVNLACYQSLSKDLLWISAVSHLG